MTVAHLADLASLVGLLLTLVGFIVTIGGVRRARKAAEEASAAARVAVARIEQRMLENEVGSIIHYLEAVQMACREKNWSVAIVRSGDARTRLSQLSPRPHLNDHERDALEELIQRMTSLLEKLETLRRANSATDLPKAFHGSLLEAVDLLGRIQGRIHSKAFEV